MITNPTTEKLKIQEEKPTVNTNKNKKQQSMLIFISQRQESQHLNYGSWEENKFLPNIVMWEDEGVLYGKIC